MQDAALQLRTRLENTLDGHGFVRDTATALAVVAALDDMFITPETLEVTRLGRCVNLLRKKTTSDELSKRAKQLVKKWQKLVKTDCASRVSTPNGLPFVPATNSTAALLRRAAAAVGGGASAGGEEDEDSTLRSSNSTVDDLDYSLSSSFRMSSLSSQSSMPLGNVFETTSNAIPTPEAPTERPAGPTDSRQWQGVDGRPSGPDGGWSSWTDCLHSADGTRVASPYVYLE